MSSTGSPASNAAARDATERAEVMPPALPPTGAAAPFQRLDASPAYPYTVREYVRRFGWALVAATLFRWSPRRAYRWRNALLRLFGARLSATSRIRPTCTVVHPWLLEMGEWSLLSDGVTVYNLGPVLLGDHTLVSQRCHLCAGSHDFTQSDLPLLRPTIRLGNGVWVAAEAFVGPGVTVGDNSVVGARAVVTKDVPPGVVVAGNPARVIKPREMRRDEGDRHAS
jgi:putative colanic acid biosynthesis acetyltransferase WcaF